MKTSSEATPAPAGNEARDFLLQCRTLIDAELDQLLPTEGAEPVNVHSAIRWSVFAGGKRLRPALLLATGQALGAPSERLLRTASALEMIHTYSLIHDDLPSMDNDDLRRGRPTCHVRFGEATAILAGDALQAFAFQTIAEDENLTPQVRVRLVAEVARAAGTPAGMVSGQAGDLAAESGDVTPVELEQIHQRKTGALISAAVRCGAIIAGATEQELSSLSRYAAQLGLLFQITDDLLDVTATAADLGKTPGKDIASRKATYPSLYGVEATREHLSSVHGNACAALKTLSQPSALLRSFADFILERQT
ncbi:MAG: polyprenyl synthetase family protein [Pyrinomonadaceae bacterium]